MYPALVYQSRVKNQEETVVNNAHTEENHHQARIANCSSHVFLRCLVEGLELDLSLRHTDKANTSLIILQSNSLKICYSDFVMFVEGFLTCQDGLLQNSR